MSYRPRGTNAHRSWVPRRISGSVVELPPMRETHARIPQEQFDGASERGWEWSGSALPGTLIVVILALLYRSIIRDLALQWWDDPNYSHGFLVPLFSGFLVWHQRAELRALTPRGTVLGLVVLVAGILELLLGDLGAENFLMRSSLLVIIAGLVLFHFGPQILQAVAFPLGFLLFMIPLPATVFYAITFPLQSFAAAQAATILEWIGIPVLLDGNVIHLSQLSLGVTEACSGIRSLISLLAGAAAWAYLALPGGWMAVVFVASAIPVTIIANVARVVLTGIIGQHWGVEYASGFFHEFAGWGIYLFAFGCLFGIHALIRSTVRMASSRAR
jgi:exosortase